MRQFPGVVGGLGAGRQIGAFRNARDLEDQVLSLEGRLRRQGQRDLAVGFARRVAHIECRDRDGLLGDHRFGGRSRSGRRRHQLRQVGHGLIGLAGHRRSFGRRHCRDHRSCLRSDEARTAACYDCRQCRDDIGLAQQRGIGGRRFRCPRGRTGFELGAEFEVPGRHGKAPRFGLGWRFRSAHRFGVRAQGGAVLPPSPFRRSTADRGGRSRPRFQRRIPAIAGNCSLHPSCVIGLRCSRSPDCPFRRRSGP